MPAVTQLTIGQQPASDAQTQSSQLLPGNGLPQSEDLGDVTGNVVPSADEHQAIPPAHSAVAAQVPAISTSKRTVPIMRPDLYSDRPAVAGAASPNADDLTQDGNPAKPGPLDVPVSRILKAPASSVAEPRLIPTNMPAAPPMPELGDERPMAVNPREMLRQLSSVHPNSETRPHTQRETRPLAAHLPASGDGVAEGQGPQPALNDPQTSASLRAGQSSVSLSNTPATVPLSAQSAAPAPMLSAGGEAAPSLRDSAPLERMVETITQMRETGQAGRAEVSLRHSDFGAISMRVMSDEGELQARLTSRDPGFLAAAQSALAEKSAAERTQSAAQDPAQSAARGQDGTTNGQGHSRGSGGLAEQGHDSENAATAHSDPAKGEHGVRSLSSDDHTRPNSDFAGRPDGSLFA